MKLHLIACSALLLSVASFSARAEPGDYGPLHTLLNLFNPPTADNPVTDEQANAAFYPLLDNPADFDDEFEPGDYLGWQTVQLHPSTGAICGNGSPYKFFVNRVAGSSNTIIYLEGGGACWDYPSCTGAAGIRGARNPDGIPDDYMAIANPAASLVSPLVWRSHPWNEVKTQNWNMVYVPYCTGDIYTGDKVVVYEDPTGAKDPVVWYHNGVKNMRAIVAWLKNNLQRPEQMLMTGCSAGGAGSLSHYATSRRDMAPGYGFLLNDSGPIYPAPINGDPRDYPSLPLHLQIKQAWGLSISNGPLDYMEAELPLFDQNDMGTLTHALATHYPNDRMGHTHFWQDLNYSGYSYERFYDDIINAPDQETKEALIHGRWHQDTNALMQSLSADDNFGFYHPYFRDVNESHCSTIIEFNNGDIQEDGLELWDFVDNVLNGSGPVMQAAEEDSVSDYAKPFNLLYWLIDNLL